MTAHLSRPPEPPLSPPDDPWDQYPRRRLPQDEHDFLAGLIWNSATGFTRLGADLHEAEAEARRKPSDNVDAPIFEAVETQ